MRTSDHRHVVTGWIPLGRRLCGTDCLGSSVCIDHTLSFHLFIIVNTDCVYIASSYHLEGSVW